MTATNTRYVAPSRGDRACNRIAGWMTRRGVSLMGSRVLAVRGRTSGVERTTVVNLLTLGTCQYLVAPRGVTHWVRNLRAAGRGELRVGRRSRAFTAHEVADADKLPVLRSYLARWGWEVGRFFEGVSKGASDDELLAIAHDFPVFEVRSPD